MQSTRMQTNATKAFSCLGDACEDTCCKGWGMQLTKETVEKYQREAPELMQAVTSGEAEYIMKRDPETDYCVKFSAGLCSIHQTRGTDFLGDACHFFPRSTRNLHEISLMTIAPSCPEAARLMLEMDAPFTRVVREDARVPFSLKSYGVEGLSDEQMLKLHDQFLAYVEEAESPADAMAGIVHLARRLDSQPQKDWPAALDFYIKQVGVARAKPEAQLTDVIHLLNALQGLVKAARASKRERLMRVIADMENALAVMLDWEKLQVVPSEQTVQRLYDMHAAWDGFYAAELAPGLKRYIQMQLSLNFFPFAGLGGNVHERATIMAVRYATIERALMCTAMLAEEVPSIAEQVRVIQSISRFLDHLADPALSLSIYKEVGWLKESRINGLLGLPRLPMAA